MADVKSAPAIPDVPAKGSDTATWIRFALTLATVLVTWYMTWNSTPKPVSVDDVAERVVEKLDARPKIQPVLGK